MTGKPCTRNYVKNTNETLLHFQSHGIDARLCAKFTLSNQDNYMLCFGRNKIIKLNDKYYYWDDDIFFYFAGFLSEDHIYQINSYLQ